MIATKLKSGTPYTLNSTPVWIDHDLENGMVSIRYCSNKYPVSKTDLVSIEDLTPALKVRAGIVSKPKVLTVEQKVVKSELDQFYDDMAGIMPFHCAECGKPLYAMTKFAKRSVTCHILPKAYYPTIATNIHNILFMGWDILGICNDHDRWDSNLETRKSMNVYHEAVDNFSKYLRFELNNEDLISGCKYLGLNWKDYEAKN